MSPVLFFFLVPVFRIPNYTCWIWGWYPSIKRMALQCGRAHISAGLLITVSCEISRITLSLIGTCTLSGSPQRRFKIPLTPLTASARERRPGSDHCPNAFEVIDDKKWACRSTVIDNTDGLITHLDFFSFPFLVILMRETSLDVFHSERYSWKEIITFSQVTRQEHKWSGLSLLIHAWQPDGWTNHSSCRSQISKITQTRHIWGDFHGSSGCKLIICQKSEV